MLQARWYLLGERLLGTHPELFYTTLVSMERPRGFRAN